MAQDQGRVAEGDGPGELEAEFDDGLDVADPDGGAGLDSAGEPDGVGERLGLALRDG
jgi:hypothetical protein